MSGYPPDRDSSAIQPPPRHPDCPHAWCVGAVIRVPFTDQCVHFACECEAKRARVDDGRDVIVYAPQGTGKTINAQAIAAFFGKSRVVDEWVPGVLIPSDSIALTNVPGIHGAVSLDPYYAADGTIVK